MKKKNRDLDYGFYEEDYPRTKLFPWWSLFIIVHYAVLSGCVGYIFSDLYIYK